MKKDTERLADKNVNLNDRAHAWATVARKKAADLRLSKADAHSVVLAAAVAGSGMLTGVYQSWVKTKKKPSINEVGTHGFPFGPETARKDHGAQFPHHHEIAWAVLTLARSTDPTSTILDRIRWLVYHLHDHKLHKKPITDGGYVDAKGRLRDSRKYVNSASILAQLSKDEIKRIQGHMLTMMAWVSETTGEPVPFSFSSSKSPSCVRPILFDTVDIDKPVRLAVASLQRSALAWSEREAVNTDQRPLFQFAKSFSIPKEYGEPLTVKVPSRKRDQDQLAEAEAAAGNITSIMASPAGSGKSRRALLWWAKKPKRSKQLLWVAPRNIVAQALFDQLGKDLKAIGLGHLSYEVYVGSSKQERRWSPPPDQPGAAYSGELNSDIIITNLDKNLVPFVRNTETAKLADVHTVDMVFDEFQECVSDSPLFAAFLILMAGRHNVTKASTLLLSATPLPIQHLWEYSGKPTAVIGQGLPMSETLIGCEILRTQEQIDSFTKDGGVTIFNAIKNTQIHTLRNGRDTCVHSKFTVQDGMTNLRGLQHHHGESNHLLQPGREVSAAPVIQASLDVSFLNMAESVAMPWDSVQRQGRHDRFGTFLKPRYGAIFLLDDPSEEGAIKSRGSYHIAGLWRSAWEEWLGSRTSFRKRDMVKFYNDFMKLNEEAVKAFIKARKQSSFEHLNEVPPSPHPRPVSEHEEREFSYATGNIRDHIGNRFITAVKYLGHTMDGHLTANEVLALDYKEAKSMAEKMLKADDKNAKTLEKEMKKRTKEATKLLKKDDKSKALRFKHFQITADSLLREARNPRSPLILSCEGLIGVQKVYHRTADGQPGLGLVDTETWNVD